MTGRAHAAGRLALVLAVAVAGLASTTAVATGQAPPAPRASFNDIEDEVMCITCNVPLNIAESPQATDEREEIRRLIAMGLTKEEILDRLVGEFGDQILADPPTDGFNVTTWLVPVGAIGGVAALLLLALPRWRRRARDEDDDSGVVPAGPQPSSADLRRLDEDLAATEV